MLNLGYLRVLCREDGPFRGPVPIPALADRRGRVGTAPRNGKSPRVLPACLVACVLCWNLAWTADQTPSELYGDLFEQVQLESVFPDSKTFADALGKRAPAQILADYRRAKQRPGFDLQKFVAANFDLPKPAGGDYRTTPGQDVREHIDSLWKVLERGPDVEQQYSSRIALPYRYVVPGGRFNEIYYWDSYFTMQGLEASGRHDLTVSMVRNFAWLIDRYGHIPNGNRTYFLSRSQPPFFAAIDRKSVV